MGQRPSRDEYGDDSRTKPHRARGYNLLALGGAKPRPRREWDNPPASQPDPNARLAFALRNHFFNHFALCWARGAGAGGERGLSTRFFNRYKVSVRRQPRGCFCIYAPDCKQVLPTTSRLRLLGDIHQPSGCREAGAMRGAYDASVVDKTDCNRPLSFSDSSTKTLFCLRRVEALRPQPLRSATAAPAFCDRRPFYLPPR